MTVTSTAISIHEMVIPSHVDDAAAADFHAVVALANAVCFAETGLHDFDHTPEEALPQLLDTIDGVTKVLLASENGELVGSCRLNYATAEPTSAEIDIVVLPENFGRGIEDALYEAAITAVQQLGRKVVQCWTLHRAAPADRYLEPATGVGRVAETAHARFLIERGFVMEQVERNSVYDLARDAAPVRDALEQALAAAGEDYRLVEWTVPTPPEWRDGYAWAMSRMSTDAPSGGLDVDEEVWDAARVERREKRRLASGQTMSVSAIEHVPSGTLAAFNELVIGADPTKATHQHCTLVLKEHRGHRLGTAVKAANILRWRGIAPSSPHISTFNAEENRPMLDINEKLGFVPASYSAAWQKRLE